MPTSEIHPTWPSSSQHAWGFGIHTFDDASYSGANRLYTGSSSAAAGAWVGQLLRFPMQPGTYTFTEMGMRFLSQALQSAAANNVDNIAFAIYTGDGITMDPVAATVRERPTVTGDDWAAASGGTAADVVLDMSADPVVFTVEDAQLVYLGMWVHHKHNANGFYPHFRNVNTSNVPNGAGTCYFFTGPSNSDTQDSTDYTTGLTSAQLPTNLTLSGASDNKPIQAFVKFTTTNPTLMKIGTSGSKFFTGTTVHQFIPWRETTDKQALVKFESVLMSSANTTLSASFRKMAGGGTPNNYTGIVSLTQDTTTAANALSFNASSNALSGTEAEDSTWDHLVQFAPQASTLSANVFSNNRLDPQSGATNAWPTYIHSGGTAATLNDYSIASNTKTPEWITVSQSGGTNEIVTLYVGSHVAVFYGDSQVVDRGGANTPPTGPLQLGPLPLAILGNMTRPLIPWLSGGGGNRFTADIAATAEAGYKRFLHPTLTTVNMSRMRGLRLFWCGFAINDISALITGTEGTAAAKFSEQELVAAVCKRLSEIAETIYDQSSVRDQQLVLIDLPDWDEQYSPSLGGNTITEPTDQKHSAILRLRSALLGLSAAFGVPYASAYELIDPTNTNHLADYLHYGDPGAELVGNAIMLAAEGDSAASVGSGISRRIVRWAASGLPYDG